ncbi:MAG: VOC family protein [Pseudomonadota bacterium]
MQGSFVWADLATFRQEVAETFYAHVLGWGFADGMAHAGGAPVAAIFTMPETFQKIGMPSFWMSYIAVESAAQVADAATALGAKVEVGPEPYGDGQIALIRDPLGAGFTVYEGPALAGVSEGPGARVGHALFISDASRITGFYEELFGWSFGPFVEGVSRVSLNGQLLFHCHEIPDPAIRGREEFWAVLFAPGPAPPDLEAMGGQRVVDVTLPEGPATLCRDPDGAAFFLMGTHVPQRSLPWKAWAGLALVAVSSLSGQVWPWLIFLCVWVAEGLRARETWLLERITRAGQPVTYWSILGLYGVLFVLVAVLVAS